jgi:hypothetical protein
MLMKSTVVVPFSWICFYLKNPKSSLFGYRKKNGKERIGGRSYGTLPFFTLPSIVGPEEESQPLLASIHLNKSGGFA